jgi:TP901 family phage tail tape measure protein
MADVSLDIDLDESDIQQGLRRTSRTLEQMERRLSRRRARNRLRRIREDRRTEQRISRDREREERNRQRMERRLSRRRARNRLREIRLRRREEQRAQRERERDQERRRERRRAFGRGAVSAAGRGASLAGFGLVGGAIGSFFDSEQILEFNRSLAILAGQAGITRKAQMELGESLTQVSILSGVARNEVLRGFEAVIEKSGDIKLAEGIINDMARASAGLGADITDLGLLGAALGTTFGKSSEDVRRFFEVLAAQGDKGTITLKDIAQVGEEIFSTAAGVGFKGDQALISIGALLQSGIGSADERKTAINNFLKTLTDQQKVESAFKGVKVKDKAGAFRDPVQIVKDIIRATKGETAPIGKVFGEAQSLFFRAAADFKDTKGFGTLDQFLSLGAESKGLIDKRFKRVEETAAVVTLEKLTNVITKLSDKTLAPALGSLLEVFESIVENEEVMNDLAEGAKALGVALSTLLGIMAGVVAGIGKLGNFFGFGGEEKTSTEVKPKVKPTPTGKASSSIQTGNPSIGLSVKNEVMVDDRGNVKKSRTRVDMQNNPMLGRTIGAIG